MPSAEGHADGSQRAAEKPPVSRAGLDCRRTRYKLTSRAAGNGHHISSVYCYHCRRPYSLIFSFCSTPLLSTLCLQARYIV